LKNQEERKMKNFNYRNVIKYQSIRIKILNLLDWLPDKWMLKLQYALQTSRFLNLKSPQRFTEKIQCYKLYYRNPLLPKLVDKFEVKGWVSDKIGSHYIIPTIGCWADASDINFNQLPLPVILKTTNGSHSNIILKNKSDIEKVEQIKKTLNDYLKKRSPKLGREWAYYGGDFTPKIIAEPLLVNEENGGFSGLTDYKFYCFNGEIAFVQVLFDRDNEVKEQNYTLDWVRLNHFNTNYTNYTIEKPKCLAEMINISENLAAEFPFVRVDLYEVNQKVYFGEMTFYPASGYMNWQPDSFDIELGKAFRLPKKF
jgi:hypothetical protein